MYITINMVYVLFQSLSVIWFAGHISAYFILINLKVANFGGFRTKVFICMTMCSLESSDTQLSG